MSVAGSKDYLSMADVMEDDQFTISVNGLEQGDAHIKEGKIKWKENGNEVIEPGQVETIRGRKCAIW